MIFSSRYFSIFFACSISLLFCLNALGDDSRVMSKRWKWQFKDGTAISESDLKRIIDDHNKWIETFHREGKKADLEGARLINADLRNANLSSAVLKGAILIKADLRSADLSRADIENAYLDQANFEDANLSWANLKNASFVDALLGNANLRFADLKDSNLMGADLRSADLYSADLDGASLYHAHGLLELRDKLYKFGDAATARYVTYNLKVARIYRVIEGNNRWEKFNALIYYCMFGLTCDFGLNPGRPFLIISGFIVVFSILYTLSIKREIKRDGIWKVWIDERVRKDLGNSSPELIQCSNIRSAFFYGFYFSVLSAFNIGWREVNIGNWIARIQPREYTFKASGWVRTVSGIQSLISVYLLALSVLSYFGRPFDQF